MNRTVKNAIETLVSLAGVLKPFVLDAGFCVLLVEEKFVKCSEISNE